jgi:uncharacterized protein YigE (DUF2233 family)
VSATYVPVGRIAAVVALAVGVWAIARGTSAPHWRTLEPGVEFATLRGEPYCRRGSSDVALLRLDPARVTVRVLHYSREPEGRPFTPIEWRRRTGALAVFNAGQYYPDLSYMGLLVSGGETISTRPHPRFRAALVSSPIEGEGGARVLDLERVPLERARAQWRDIAQSFMLFDERGVLRVRKTDQVANRTVVAEDRKGKLVVAASEGGYTLWEFAELLERAPLGLSHAMSMDGGHEAELCVASGPFRYANFGRWDGGPEPEGSVPLPAVIAVMSR